MPTKRPDSNLPRGIKVVTKRSPEGTTSRYLYARLPDNKLSPLLHPRTGRRLQIDDERPIIEGALRHALRAPMPQITRAGIPLLISDYRDSPDFKDLAKNTRQRYGRSLDLIRDRFAWMTIDDLGTRKVRDDFYRWRDSMAATPAAAD